MSKFIVDSSVGLKWFVAEIHQKDAQRLQNPAYELHVPMFFDVEVTNILWKKARRGELTKAEVDTILGQLSLLPLNRHSEAQLLAEAFELAYQNDRTVYDSLNLALAIRLGGQAVTADRRLYNAIAATSLARHICWVEDVP
jgi:predicted nucleic acid-binding protein